MPRQPWRRSSRRGLGNNYTEVLKEAKVGSAMMKDMIPATTQRTKRAIVSFTAE
jgi:hypothetical protein